MNTQSFYFSVTGVEHSTRFATRQNVRKPINHILFQGTVEDEDVPLAYVGSEEIDPASNLHIVHLEDVSPANAKRAFEAELRWVGTTTSIHTEEFLLTDVWGDFAGEPVPFYWKHVLPSTSIAPDSVAILYEDLTEVPKYSYRTIRTNTYDDTGAAVSGSYESCAIFSNYRNSYDTETGETELYFVRFEVSGSTHYELLNSVPAFSKATFEDIWSVTARLKPWRRVYVISQGTSGYVITTPSGAASYSLVPREHGRVVTKDPRTVGDDEPWFLTISDGSFSDYVDNTSFFYSVPEFSGQTFNPLQPYKIRVQEKAEYIRGDIIKVDYSPLQVDTSFYVMDILVKDRSGNLLYALTTKTTKDEDYYEESGARAYRTIETNNAWVQWDAGGIIGWDSEGGFIHLLDDYPDTYEFFVTYYYEERSFELTSLNLNPIFDEAYDGHWYSIYAVPTGGNNGNLGTQDSAIHYVKVDRSGQITETSQDADSGNYDLSSVIETDGVYIRYDGSAESYLRGATTYPTGSTSLFLHAYDLLNSEGEIDLPQRGVLLIGDEVNQNTTASGITFTAFPVGYTSWSTSSPVITTTTTVQVVLASPLATAVPPGVTVRLYTFEDLLSYTGDNKMRWLVLANVHIAASYRPDELSIIDLRQRGGVIKDRYFAQAVAIDPRAEWAREGRITGKGQEIPGESAAVIYIPYTILSDYGGTFTIPEVEEIVKKHIAAGVMPVVIFHGAIPEFSSAVPTATTITVCWYSEGTDYSYNVYYGYTKDGPWTLSSESPITDQIYGNCTTITGLSADRVYYIKAAAVDSSGNEGPSGVVWGVKTLAS